MVSLFEKASGCLVGAAIGDALGMPTEYISQRDLDTFYKGRVTDFEKATRGHPCSHLNAGQYTDDTQQLMILAESLVENNGFDINYFGKKLGEWGHKCRTESGFDRFSGGTSLSAALELYSGKSPYETGKPRPTCGSAMRVAPVGVWYHNLPHELEKMAKISSQITHTHPAAVDAAVLISSVIANLLNGRTPSESVEQSKKLLVSDLNSKINYIINNHTKHPLDVVKIIGASESVYETVPMALYCFLHTPLDFEQTVITAANLVPGDTDSIACIAGALSGACNGIAAIPDRFKLKLEDFEKLTLLGQSLVRRD
jgi:ADP-ribosylglycohydrolase